MQPLNKINENIKLKHVQKGLLEESDLVDLIQPSYFYAFSILSQGNPDKDYQTSIFNKCREQHINLI